MQFKSQSAALSCAIIAFVFTTGCTSSKSTPTIELAQAFRAHTKAGEYDDARTMMSHDPRRWFEVVDGEGRPWTIEPGTGPWAAWDREFRSQTKIIRWDGDDRSATLTYRETNEYFQLLERGWVTNQNVYLFDDDMKVRGLLIRAIGERPPGRTEEFEAWARANDPEELAYLEPAGEVDPSGDRPQRYRALLNRWRQSAGREVIE